MSYGLGFQVATGAGINLKKLSTNWVGLRGEGITACTPEKGANTNWNMEVPDFFPSFFTRGLVRNTWSLKLIKLF